jgi:hypothetical protein
MTLWNSAQMVYHRYKLKTTKSTRLKSTETIPSVRLSKCSLLCSGIGCRERESPSELSLGEAIGSNLI